jgi:diaminopropionate ammonia-lyase
VIEFHRSLPGYAPTPLIEAPELAAEWGADRVLLKFEKERFGLPAFKMLGVTWAAERLQPAAGTTLVAATDGNHGRAVARVAAMRGLSAHILVPKGTAQARIDAIRNEGAHVEVVDGSYDDAVRRSAALAGDTHLVLSDTSWPGYEDVPRWVIEGYSTIFEEIDEQPDTVFVPVGVGSLAAAAAHAYPGRRLISVEPEGADCMRQSVLAGRLAEIPLRHSIMAGLSAGLPSLIAFPVVRDTFAEFLAIPDDVAVEGMRRLKKLGIEAGECSGGAVGAAARHARGAGTVLVLLTEGVTDPELYGQLVDQSGVKTEHGV